MSKRTDKFYGNPPKLARDEKGKLGIQKGKKAAAPTGDGMEADAIPVHVRHADERLGMTTRHEREHGMHDSKGGAGKEEMHKRHQHEMKSMHARHAKELAGNDSEAKPHKEKDTASEGEKKTPEAKPAKKD